MKTYLITGTMTVTCAVEIEAEDAELALDKARAIPPQEWDIEKDGMPEDLTVEESV